MEMTTLFPDECPKLTCTDREVWFKAGQAYVVKFLKLQYELQQKEDR